MPLLVVAVLNTQGVSSAAAPLAESTDALGLVDPATGRWHLREPGGDVEAFYFGDPGDQPFLGDWDCDGIDTPGLYRRTDGYVYLRNSNTSGVANIRFYFGDPGDFPVAGDFDGDGCDTVSLFRPATGRVYVINRLGGGDRGLGAADTDYTIGDPGDVPFAGDFDGDGVDTFGALRPADGRVFLRNHHGAGAADLAYTFGNPGDLPVIGAWGGAGDAVGVYRPDRRTFYLRHDHGNGPADTALAWGEQAWLPVAGRVAARPQAPAAREAATPPADPSPAPDPAPPADPPPADPAPVATGAVAQPVGPGRTAQAAVRVGAPNRTSARPQATEATEATAPATRAAPVAGWRALARLVASQP